MSIGLQGTQYASQYNYPINNQAYGTYSAANSNNNNASIFSSQQGSTQQSAQHNDPQALAA